MHTIKSFFARIVMVIPILFGCATDPADALLLRLADAFEKKDLKEIQPLVADGWSGLRFCENWTDAQWQAAATELRQAKPTSKSATEKVYSVTRQRSPTSESREIKVLLLNGAWQLDLNSFLGPFPHL